MRHSSIAGKGTWVFNRKLAAAESLDFQQNLSIRQGNLSVAVPLTIKYRRLSADEIAQRQEEQKRRAEELKQRLAERRAKEAVPLTDAERDQIVANLKSNKLTNVLGGLPQLGRKRNPEPNAEITAALESLLDHQSRLVQRQAKAMLEKWSADDGE